MELGSSRTEGLVASGWGGVKSFRFQHTHSSCQAMGCATSLTASALLHLSQIEECVCIFIFIYVYFYICMYTFI
jgi:hypothetical protein